MTEKEKKMFFFERLQLYKLKKLAEAALTEEQRQEFREMLESQRTQLLTEKTAFSNKFKSELWLELEKGRSGNHIADTNIEQSLTTQKLLTNRLKRIPKIDEAVKRLENGLYGICLECARPIGIGRLLHAPIADLCEECKTAKEQKERLLLKGTNRRPPQPYFASP